MDTTTIEITEDQKADLDTFKNAESESYKEVLQRIIDHYKENGDAGLDEQRARDIAREAVNDMVRPRALE